MTAVLDAARALHERVRAEVPTMQAERRLTAPVVEGMRLAGVFDMALPASLGGPGLTPLEQFKVLETLTIGDASVGWCGMIGADSGYLPGFLDDETFVELYPSRNLVTAGKVMPSGKAVPHGDGWRSPNEIVGTMSQEWGASTVRVNRRTLGLAPDGHFQTGRSTGGA